ncbi:MAG: hypothetical protein DBX51_00650 [Clostridiales bacterium]|nr:MAG: hypothetical protein DBX51_00650 [Clostridiales bacterium]
MEFRKKVCRRAPGGTAGSVVPARTAREVIGTRTEPFFFRLFLLYMLRMIFSIAWRGFFAKRELRRPAGGCAALSRREEARRGRHGRQKKKGKALCESLPLSMFFR